MQNNLLPTKSPVDLNHKSIVDSLFEQSPLRLKSLLNVVGALMNRLLQYSKKETVHARIACSMLRKKFWRLEGMLCDLQGYIYPLLMAFRMQFSSISFVHKVSVDPLVIKLVAWTVPFSCNIKLLFLNSLHTLVIGEPIHSGFKRAQWMQGLTIFWMWFITRLASQQCHLFPHLCVSCHQYFLLWLMYFAFNSPFSASC